MEKIKIDLGHSRGGVYGVHDGFFNAIAIIAGTEYDFQCCTEKDGSVNWSDCGYDEGQCADTNGALAEKIGWDGVFYALKKAYKMEIL